MIFSLATPTTRSQPFSVHPQTGVVRLVSPLDRETRASYRLTVLASDRSNDDPLTSSAALEVTVLDRNDNAPLVTARTFSRRGGVSNGDDDAREGEAVVEENAAAGAFLAHVTCSDPDAGSNGMTTCRLVPAEVRRRFRLRRIDDAQYKLTTGRPLDREYADRYTVRVVCTDSGSPTPLTGGVTVGVRVVDRNDNPPRFTELSYTFPCDEDDGAVGRENAAVIPTRHLGRVEATDRDANSYGTVRYSFASPQELFVINATDGRVEARGRSGSESGSGSGKKGSGGGLDYEARRVYEMGVVATDGGGSESRAGLTIVLRDVNDNGPLFTRGEGGVSAGGRATLRLEVYENLPAGVRVVSLNSTDLDTEARHTRRRYSLVMHATRTPDTQAPPVHVHPDTGQLTTAISYDRENASEYGFSVRVTDSGRSSLGDTLPCVLHVLDRNDNAPVLATPPFPVAISARLPLGGVAYALRASDSDSSAHLRYSLSPAHSAFVVDARSGIVTSARHFDVEVVDGFKDFRFLARITDDLEGIGRRVHEVTASVTFRVNSSIPYPAVTSNDESTSPASEARIRHIAIVVAIVAATVLAVVLLSAAILILRKRERDDSKLNSWALPISIEKVCNDISH